MKKFYVLTKNKAEKNHIQKILEKIGYGDIRIRLADRWESACPPDRAILPTIVTHNDVIDGKYGVYNFLSRLDSEGGVAK